MSEQTPGNGSPNSPSGTGAPEALTEERIAQIASNTMNSVFEGRSKKLKKEITEEFSKALDPISKQLADFATAMQQPGGKKKKDGETEDPGSPEMRGLQRQLAEQKAATDALTKQLADAKTKQRSTALRQAVSEELGKHGIAGPHLKGALASIFADGKARFDGDDDDAKPVFAENEDSLIDLPTGIKAWVKLDENKIYLPPSGARGSGDRPGQGPPKNQQNGAEPSATDIGLALVREYGGIPVSG